MSGEKDLEQLKKEAAEKAKAAALAKMKAKQEGESTPTTGPATPSADEEKTKAIAAAKAKAAAAAKAKAAALAKQQRDGTAQESASETTAAAPTDDEKAKAIAAAKAKAAAAAKAKAAAAAKQAGTNQDTTASGDDEKAKAIAAAKAKAAAIAAAKAKLKSSPEGEPTAPATETTPSPNQPYLDKYVKVIEEHLGKDVLAASYINKLSKDVPTLEAKPESYYKIAEFLRYNEQLSFDYLSEFHGSDFETHMEVYAHLYSYKNRQTVALKVKIDRNEPQIESLAHLWAGANWPECEAYDLLGIQFKNHPKLYRIMLGEEWIGYPLRKDYEPYDVEV